MTRHFCIAMLLLLASGPAPAITGDDAAERAASLEDADYAAGVAAFERQDWPAVLASMTKVIARRPWRDNAYTRMGYAHRKLGDYEAALEAYAKALELNPYNRGALEYLGEAYLDLGRRREAKQALDRLARECRRIAPGAQWRSNCKEWQDLKAAYDAHPAGENRR